MGSEDLLTVQQVARMLGVTTDMVQKLVRQGLLKPQYQGSITAPRLYREADVAALVEAREAKLDLTTVAAMARQAHTASRSLERVVKQLLELLGADVPLLSLEKEDVLSLCAKVDDALEEEFLPEAREVLSWAKVFYAIGEEYFGLVESHLGEKEPWKRFLDLGQKLVREAPRKSFVIDKELEATYGYLEVARRNLRNAAFFYVANKHGQRLASGLFPEVKRDRHEDIITLAFPA